MGTRSGQKAKMLAGEPYHPMDPELVADRDRARLWMKRYNDAFGETDDARREILREIFAEVGEGAVIRPPFHCDYGYNIRIGAGAFMNFGCCILDIVEVTIGDGAQIGPAVQIYAADHPRDPEQRRAGIEWGRPVRIGRNAWIGGGAILVPGVTVGDDAVIGAGAVVTRDVAPGATVTGNPARAAVKRQE